MAEELGKRLLGKVEEVGVGEILNALHLQDISSVSPSYFGFLPLDRLLQAAQEGRPHPTKTPPILELTSLHPGAGATHLLYHLTALAVLPRDYGGSQNCVVIFDTDGNFNVDRLVDQVRLLLTAHNHADRHSSTLNDTILHALRHTHIFRPQSLASVTATLNTLPSYLFNQARHFSFDRQVAFIAIDSISAFYWQDRAGTEDAAFYAKTSGAPAKLSGYGELATALKKMCATLQCPAIFTTWHFGPISISTTSPQMARSFRPSVLAGVPTLRLACQRVPVKRFPPMVSVEDARREAGDRLKAVEEGKLECFVNEWGVDERMLRQMHGAGGGFEFNVMAGGVHF